MWKQATKICFDVLVGAGALACVLVWLEVKPKDVRMMTWPHWLWLVGALVLFAISLGSSLRSLYLGTVARRRWDDQIASINHANTEQIARINKQHESDEYRIRQARDEIAAELRTANEKYLAENVEKTNFQKELARAETKLRDLQSNPSTSRPRVIAVRYGMQARDNRAGLFVTNDGEPAYDVTVPEAIQFGSAKLAFHTRSIARLAKSDGEVLCEGWIQQDSHRALLGDALFHEMIAQHVDAIELPIHYKDGDNRQYVTQCRIERDVSANGGIAVRYIEQQLASAKPLVEAIDQIVATLPEPHLEILSPLMHGEVGLYRLVKGSIFPPNSDMQVLVRAGEWWYLQGSAQVDGAAWSKDCKFGLDTPSYGGDYKIIVLLGKSVTESKIKELPDVPKSEEIKVRRTHDGGKVAT